MWKTESTFPVWISLATALAKEIDPGCKRMPWELLLNTKPRVKRFCCSRQHFGLPECSVPLMGPAEPSPYHHRSQMMSRVSPQLVAFWICLCHSNPQNHCTSTNSKSVWTHKTSISFGCQNVTAELADILKSETLLSPMAFSNSEALWISSFVYKDLSRKRTLPSVTVGVGLRRLEPGHDRRVNVARVMPPEILGRAW
jgi:hypothetical protein